MTVFKVLANCSAATADFPPGAVRFDKARKPLSRLCRIVGQAKKKLFHSVKTITEITRRYLAHFLRSQTKKEEELSFFFPFLLATDKR